MDNFVTQDQLASTMEQAIERSAVKIVEKLGPRDSVDSAVSALSRTGSVDNLNNRRNQASASPVISENMPAG